jgi:predicted HicB family RNase H-like nuclease
MESIKPRSGTELAQIADRYTYRVTWSPEDNSHVASCLELPSLSWIAKTATTSLQGIQKLVIDVLQDMQDQREELPVALAERNYSGEFRLRIPPTLHRELSIQAAELGISLNRLASNKLAG